MVRPFIMVLASVGMLSSGLRAEPAQCLGRAEQRAAIAEKRAIPLAAARRLLREHLTGDIVKARLCESPTGLIYLLTILSHDGKVRRITINATNGAVIGSLSFLEQGGMRAAPRHRGRS